jgi:hypothetical protein
MAITYISEMKAEIKLCVNSFDMVNLPGFPAWSRSSTRVCNALNSNMSRMCNSQQAQMPCMGRLKSCVVLSGEKVIGSKFSGFHGGHKSSRGLVGCDAE